MDSKNRLTYTDKFINKLYSHMSEKTIPMCASNVMDSIGEDYKKWYYKNPVFIDAPTGTGKTTFVYKKLIPHVIENDQHLLLVSNRIALSLQQKQEIVSIVNELAPGSISITPEDLQSVDLSKIYLLGPICVVTYQSLNALLNSTNTDTQIPLEWLFNLKLAVFDEIHFCFSDALFNDICGSLLEKLPIIFTSMVRVYMTATSWEIKEPILKAERAARSKQRFFPLSATENFLVNIPPETKSEYTLVPSLLYYYKNAEYTSYRLHFFGDNIPLQDCIKTEFSKGITKKDYLHSLACVITSTSGKDNHNKWAVFVDKRNSGATLKKLLAEKGIKCAYFDSSVKQPPSAWDKLINENKVSQSVLIATPVIDSGVNIVDPETKNVAIFCTDRTTFVQLLGRKRLTCEKAVDLWVWVPDQSYFKHIAQKMITELDLARNLASCRKNYNKDPLSYAKIVRWIWTNRHIINYPTLFYIDNKGFLSVDFYVRKILSNRLKFIQQFIRENEPLCFQKQVEEWLGIRASDRETNPLYPKSVTHDAERVNHISKLQNDLEKNIGKSITGERFKSMQNRIIETARLYASINYRKKPQFAPSAKTLNGCLKALGIPLTINKAANIWTIHRIE